SGLSSGTTRSGGCCRSWSSCWDSACCCCCRARRRRRSFTRCSNGPAPPRRPPRVAAAAGHPMQRELLRKLRALGGSVLVAILVVEGGLRALGRDVPLVWEPDPVLGWKHIPGARRHWTEEGDGWIEINDLGLRDRPRRLDKPPDTFRVSVFGDSMTEAVQVRPEQTFTAQLEAQVSQGGRPVEVLNHGVNGYSTLQELLLFRREGPRFRPNLVVLAVFLDNDVADCHPDLRSSEPGVPYAFLAGDSLRFNFSGAERSYADYHAEPAYTARKYSATYRFLGDRLRHMSAARGASGPAPREV